MKWESVFFTNSQIKKYDFVIDDKQSIYHTNLYKEKINLRTEFFESSNLFNDTELRAFTKWLSIVFSVKVVEVKAAKTFDWTNEATDFELIKQKM